MTAPDRPAAVLPDSTGRVSARRRPGGVQGIEELLRERLRLDDLSQQHVRHDMTLLFTDIQDAPPYFERSGDAGSQRLLQRHNDLIRPLISSHHGTIVRSTPETIMASYAEPTSAVQSAIAMQRALRDHNRGREVAEQIHIRIGINAGPGAVDTQDVFRDVVHVAARVEACALPDQILISSATYERLPPSVPCRFLGATEIRGQATPIELYEVSWDERRTLQETVLLRGPGVIARPTKIFALALSREGQRLKLSAHERWPGEEKSLRHYDYLDVSWEAMQQDVDALASLLHGPTDHRGTLAAATWQEVKAHGAALYSRLLTPAIQAQLRASTATDLCVHIDDALVQVPWELLFDGAQFLCRRFSMGRLVSTQQTPVERQERQPEHALSILIVANPQGDLPAAEREGNVIREELAGDAERLRVECRHHRVSRAAVTAALARFNVLHYAGHADYDLEEPGRSGWRLADGKLTARDVRQLGATTPMPALVFCNACQSAQTPAWTLGQEAEQRIYGLANGFLLAGTQHYIGSFWELPDQPGATCAIAFYRTLARGVGVGEALRRARQSLAERYGEDSVAWASYVLYGDPTCRYLEASVDAGDVDPEPAVAETVTRGDSRPYRRRLTFWSLGAGALLLVGLVAALLLPPWWTETTLPPSPLSLAYQALAQGDAGRAHTLFQQQVEASEPGTRSQAYAGLAAVALDRGDQQQALDFAAQAERADADTGYSHVIRGHILFNQGRTTEALAAYRTAASSPRILPWQQAVAYDRLGRLYAAQGDTARALEHYDRAMPQHREPALVQANKAHLLDTLGQRQEALELYRQALQSNPDDPLTRLLLRDAERRHRLAHDREQQQRIDRLVAALVQAYRDDSPAAPEDEWASRPLTLAFLPFAPLENLSARAGEAEFVVLSLTQALRDSGRVTVVEREVLDKVLAELHLSATEIVRAPQALRKGKLLAARLLAAGSLSRFGQMGLLSVRLIETETTTINAAVSQFLERPDEVVGLMQRVAQQVLDAIRHAYPLQGRIAQLTPQGEVVLDLGAQHGVTPGLVLQVLDSEPPPGTETRVIPEPVGRIEVTQVTARWSQARVLEQHAVFAPGSKVREVLAQ